MLFRSAEVRVARAVANPGCYATAAILGVAPLAAAGLIDGPVHLDGKSGVTGAGRTPSEKTHLPEIANGVTPYAVTGHRHLAEIEQELGIAAGSNVTINFTPHLIPVNRGIHTTIYAAPEDGIEPWVYQLARIGEKRRRLHGPLKTVDIEKTLMDIAGHAVVAIACLRSKEEP